VLSTLIFKNGKGVYFLTVDVAVKVTQYHDKAVVEEVPIEAQTELLPY